MSRYTLLVLLIQCLSCIMLLAHDTSAQGTENIYLSVNWKNAGLRQVLSDLEQNTQFDFSYKDSEVANLGNISLKAHNKSLKEILIFLSKEKKLKFLRLNDVISVSRIPSGSKQPVVEELDLDREISGKVTDQNSLPLPGANVLVSGTALGTTTDVDGNYRLTVPDDAVMLVFSFIGYATEEVEIAGRSVIDMVMLPDVTALEEITVSTGYWEVEERLSTSNIAKVEAKVIEQQPVSNPLQAIQGRMTGVNIVQNSGVPGSGFEIQIRGLNSLRPDGNDPLFLVNGIPYPSNPISQSQNGNVLNVNPLNYINPNDIESIEILKDADATAIYGSRGANGVVLITTKSGNSGKTRVNVNSLYGFGTLQRKLDVLNLTQYMEMRNEAYRNEGTAPGDESYDVNGTWDLNRETDWQEELLGGSSKFVNHQLNISGGNESTTYLISGNYHKETVFYSDDFFDRKFSTNFNFSHSSENKKLKLGLNGVYTINTNRLFRANLAQSAVTLPPNAPPLYNEDGSLNWENGTFFNPLATLETSDTRRTAALVAGLDVGYEILKGLEIKSTLGFNNIQNDEIILVPSTSFNPFMMAGLLPSASFRNNFNRTWIIEPQLSYKVTVGKNAIDALVGSTFQEINTEQEEIQAQGYTSDALLSNPAAAGETILGFFNSTYKFNSIFGRINYNYDNKYIANFTIRRDGSSRFGPDKRFATFASLGVTYLFSEEAFISENLPFLSFGKLRGSFGTTGSDAIGDYQFLELWESNGMEYDGLRGIRPWNLFSADFAWEETQKIDIGLELGFFKDRISLHVAYFLNESDNQLVGLPLPWTTGFSNIQSNFPALVRNQGWEIELSAKHIRSQNFQWQTDFNITIEDNKLVEFDNIENSFFNDDYIIGESLFIERLYLHTGINPETGTYIFLDENGDGAIRSNDDTSNFVDTQPDFYGGISNVFSYKGLSLEFLFRFIKQIGFGNLNGFAIPGGFLASNGFGNSSGNQPIQVLDRWQQPGNITRYQRFVATSGEARNAHSNFRSSTGNFSNASYVRLQNVALSYTFPATVTERIGLNNLRLYMQGQNLYTLTNYDGWDPETQSLVLPPPRIITFGFNMTL